MDPELRMYLRAVVLLLAALVVTTTWLLVDAVGNLLPVALVSVFAVLLAQGLYGYLSTDDGDGAPTSGDDQAGAGPDRGPPGQ